MRYTHRRFQIHTSITVPRTADTASNQEEAGRQVLKISNVRHSLCQVSLKCRRCGRDTNDFLLQLLLLSQSLFICLDSIWFLHGLCARAMYFQIFFHENRFPTSQQQHIALIHHPFRAIKYLRWHIGELCAGRGCVLVHRNLPVASAGPSAKPEDV